MSAQKCRGCGCTDAKACPGGCSWVKEFPGVCSACVLMAAANLLVKGKLRRKGKSWVCSWSAEAAGGIYASMAATDQDPRRAIQKATATVRALVGQGGLILFTEEDTDAKAKTSIHRRLG